MNELIKLVNSTSLKWLHDLTEKNAGKNSTIKA